MAYLPKQTIDIVPQISTKSSKRIFNCRCLHAADMGWREGDWYLSPENTDPVPRSGAALSVALQWKNQNNHPKRLCKQKKVC